MKNRKHREAGGEIVRDEKLKPARYNQSKVMDEAEERKCGGKTVMKRKEGGKVMGEKPHDNMGRTPRKSGGKTIYGKPIMSAAGKMVG